MLFMLGIVIEYDLFELPKLNKIEPGIKTTSPRLSAEMCLMTASFGPGPDIAKVNTASQNGSYL